MKNFYKRTWSEINLDVLKSNIAKIREISRGKDIIAIVKANAYGHGDVQCAKAMNDCGVKHFAVSNLWEAQQLSSGRIEGEILIFFPCLFLRIASGRFSAPRYPLSPFTVSSSPLINLLTTATSCTFAAVVSM